MKAFIFVALFAFSSIANCQRVVANDPLIVEIANGRLRGSEVGLYYIWDSVPYAEPPVGELRFEAPQPYRRRWTEVFNATDLSPYCMQWYRDKGQNMLRGVEDCLKLSVFKPKRRSSERFPVVVFIEGAGFMSGGAAAYDPDQFMASSRAILVRVSYRLGPLGFLSTQDALLPGNYGLKDQRLALQWIKENIGQFGGDPEKILLYGFSAGGASAHLHMLQPQFGNLVKAVVSASGVASNPWAMQANPRENAFRLADLVNCSNAQNTQQLKRCLQTVKAEDLVRNVQGLLNFGYNPFSTFGPVIEPINVRNAFLNRQPLDIIRSGRFSHLPWLVSFTTDEGAFNAAELMRINFRNGLEFIYDLNERWLSVAPQNLFLRNIIPDQDVRDYASQLKHRYVGNQNFSKETYFRLQQMYTDVLFKDGILDAMQLHSQYSHAPVFGYIYNNPAEYNIGYDMSLRKDMSFGTNHGDDVTLMLYAAQRSSPRPDEVQISRSLVKMLIDFVETGQVFYRDCKFEDNRGKFDHLSFMEITKEGCRNVVQQITPDFK